MIGDYTASYLPFFLVPLTTLLFPLITMGLLFIYIESDAN